MGKESSSVDSVTRWFVELRDGNQDAAALLWEHYFPRLVTVARQRFGADTDAAYDAEDAVQSVLHVIWRGAIQGRYAKIDSRDALWKLLVTATRNRVIDRERRQGAAKRGGDRQQVPLEPEMVAPEPTPEMVAIMDEELVSLLKSLRDDTLRRIAIARLEGYSKPEIAKELEVSERTIDRKLELIRGDWQKRLDRGR